MKQLLLGSISGPFTESAEELYGYPTMHKIIDGILTGKSAYQIVEECCPPNVEKEDWGTSEVANLIQRLLLKTGVNHPETNLLKDEIGLGARVQRGNIVELVEVIKCSDGRWCLRIVQEYSYTLSKMVEPTEMKFYTTYAEAVDDWLWATR